MTEEHTGTPGNEKLKKILAECSKQYYQEDAKPTTIKVSEEFKMMGKGIWLGIERTISNGEDEVTEILKARQKLNDAFHAMNPQQSWIPPSGFTTESLLEKVIPEINLEKERVEILIDNSQTVEELEGYKDGAEKHNLQKQYRDKLEFLITSTT